MTQFALLVSRRFAPLFLVQFLGAFNDNLYKTALVLFIAFRTVETGHSAQIVMLAGAIFIAPFVLFSGIAGQVADRYDKAHIIRWIKLIEIGIMALAVLGFHGRSIPLLLLALFLMGAQSALFGPIKYGILPQYLRPSELLGGSGLVQMGTYLAILQGTTLGGWLIHLEQGGAGLSALYGTMLGVALAGWLLSLLLVESGAADPHLRIGLNPLRETRRTLLLAVRDHSGAVFNILAIAWFWFLGAAYLAYLPLYVREVLHGDSASATLLLAGFTLGVGSGALCCELLARGRAAARLVPLGALGLAFFSLDLFLAGSLPPGSQAGVAILLASWEGRRILFDICLVGFSGGLYIVPLYALLLQRAQVQCRARLIAACNIVDALFVVLSALSVTLLYDWLKNTGLPGYGLFVALAGMHACYVPLVLFIRPWLRPHPTDQSG